MLLPLTDAIIDNPNNANAKYSGAPKLNATLLICGEKNSRQSALTTPPKVDATNAISNAFKGCPFFAMGYPSKRVAQAPFVPGVLIKIALIEPPKFEP